MEDINKIRIMAGKDHCIKPGVLSDYTPIRYATFRLRRSFRFSYDWKAKNLIEFLDEVLELPDVDEYGDKIKYVLKKNNREIDGNLTLGDAGVLDGDILKIVPVTCESENELEIVETEDLIKPEIALRPPDEILEPFNKIVHRRIKIKEYIEDLLKDEGDGDEKEKQESSEKNENSGEIK